MNPDGDSHEPLIAFDVGNSTVKCAARVAGRWRRLARVPTLPTEGLSRRLLDAVSLQDVGGAGAARCVACSVHPPADDQVRAVWARVGGTGPAQFFGRDLPIPLPMKLPRPEKVGTDRLLLSLGARDVAGAPCITVSAGTAVTVDLVDRDGAFAGGAIAPGLGLAARALHRDAALLPLVDPARPAQAVGTDTAEAVLSGIYWFCAGGVATLAALFRSTEAGAGAAVVCTGSDAGLLLPGLRELKPRHEPDLIYLGMETALTAPR